MRVFVVTESMTPEKAYIGMATTRLGSIKVYKF